MNYLVPVLLGSPDMANITSRLFKCLYPFSFFKFKKATYRTPIFKKIKSYSSLPRLPRKTQDCKLGSYLAGLIEGDGYISINNRNRVLIGITFNSKDHVLAEKLLLLIGKGYIVKRKTCSIELRFSSKSSLCSVINLVNGKFRTPKIDQLFKLIDWINLNHSTNYVKLALDSSPINSNRWLSGFIDADGGFYIRHSLKQIICKFSLEQRMTYPKTLESYETILSKISDYLNVKLAIRERTSYKNSYYIIRVENHKSLNILIDYLNVNPLLSSKYLDFLDWQKAFSIIISKTHFTEEGRKSIFILKNSMNNNRKIFNWEHLNKLQCRLS